MCTYDSIKEVAKQIGSANLKTDNRIEGILSGNKRIIFFQCL